MNQKSRIQRFPQNMNNIQYTVFEYRNWQNTHKSVYLKILSLYHKRTAYICTFNFIMKIVSIDHKNLILCWKVIVLKIHLRITIFNQLSFPRFAKLAQKFFKYLNWFSQRRFLIIFTNCFFSFFLSKFVYLWGKLSYGWNWFRIKIFSFRRVDRNADFS